MWPVATLSNSAENISVFPENSMRQWCCKLYKSGPLRKLGHEIINFHPSKERIQDPDNTQNQGPDILQIHLANFSTTIIFIITVFIPKSQWSKKPDIFYYAICYWHVSDPNYSNISFFREALHMNNNHVFFKYVMRLPLESRPYTNPL